MLKGVKDRQLFAEKHLERKDNLQSINKVFVSKWIKSTQKQHQLPDHIHN